MLAMMTSEKPSQQHFCRGVRPLPNECPRYDPKPSTVEASALEIWGM